MGQNHSSTVQRGFSLGALGAMQGSHVLKRVTNLADDDSWMASRKKRPKHTGNIVNDIQHVFERIKDGLTRENLRLSERYVNA